MKKIVLLILITLILGYGIFTGVSIFFGDSKVTLSDIRISHDNQEVEAVLDSLTIEEKVGQMFMGCFYNGTPTADTVNNYHLGSVLLFGASFKNTDKETLTGALHELDCAGVLAPIIAVDEEGGLVTRVSSSLAFRETPFKSSRELFAHGGMEAIIEETHEKNALLKELGINLNLAPVCDVSQSPSDFMYSRSLGRNAKVTSEYAAKTVEACLADNIGCCLKHFPGYGDSADTHKGLAVDSKSLEQIEKNDLLPFKAGIEAGAPSVLVSHNIVTSIDGDRPASLSPAMHRILRENMDFDGVILTDDMSMGAIVNYFSNTDSAVAAIMAGNDMICTGDFKNQYKAVLSAVNNGEIAESRIDMSVKKIIKWKLDLGLIDPEDFEKTE